MVNPLVSIITVCFNSSRTILETITSVNNQTYQQIEHIFIDGQSSDNTVSIIEENAERGPCIISEEDSGLYDAMNKGIKLCRGTIIFILNSDDIFFNKHVVENIVELFIQNPKIEIVYSNILFSENENLNNIIRYWKLSSEYKKGYFHKGWHPPHPGFVVKKKIYDKLGYFDLKFKIAADFDIMLRFMEVHSVPAKFYNDFTVVLRYGGASTGLKGIIKTMKEINLIFKKNNIVPERFLLIKRYWNKLNQFKIYKVDKKNFHL